MRGNLGARTPNITPQWWQPGLLSNLVVLDCLEAVLGLLWITLTDTPSATGDAMDNSDNTRACAQCNIKVTWQSMTLFDEACGFSIL